MREEEVAVKSRNFQVTVKSSGDISAEPVREQKSEEHVVTDLDGRNDENRPSLTSGAAAERQEVSSKNTIDELSDAITGGKRYRSLVIQYTGKDAGILVEKRKVICKTRCSTTQKTETRHGNAPQILFVARTTTPKSLKGTGFVFLLHKHVLIVSRVD